MGLAPVPQAHGNWRDWAGAQIQDIFERAAQNLPRFRAMVGSLFVAVQTSTSAVAWKKLYPTRYEEAFTATDSFDVNHGLGAYPVAQVIDGGGAVVGVSITHLDTNRLRLEFAGSLSARVVCVIGV